MTFISKPCITDLDLIKLFDRLPQQTGTCTLSKKENVVVIDGSEREFIMALRALTRYYVHEWEYNGHFGGETDKVKFLKQKSLFFNFEIIVDEDAFEEYIYGDVFGEGYYEYDKGVSMYAGYYEGQQNPLLEAIGTVRTSLVRKVNAELHERELSKLLITIKEIVDLSLPRTRRMIENLMLFRARIGYKKSKFVNNFDFTATTHYFPFIGGEIGPPPVEFSNKGRMNREGFSFLYLAEDAETVVAEVRASPGDTISIGKFKQVEALAIADFSEITIDKFWSNDKELDLFEKLHSIAKFISNPVGTNEGYVYVLTQLIAEELLRQGINGICFTSSLTGKKNYTIFKAAAFDYDTSKAFVCHVNRIKTEFEYLTVGDDKTDYFEL